MVASPVVYSFRRCPYAMRARLALWQSGITFELREVLLKDKPEDMLKVSPKGTVPVMVLDNSIKTGTSAKPTVIDESLDIMLWALTSKDPSAWLPLDQHTLDEQLRLIEYNDTTFKGWLDKYKYFDRYPEQSQSHYREQAETFLIQLNERLQSSSYLSGETFGLLDAAIAPFIRQFAHVDLIWFESSSYIYLIDWLDRFKASDLFNSVMKKFPQWDKSMSPVLINQAVN
jgi:glutathione S-transferase